MAAMVGPTISAGFKEPAAARKAITVVGSRVKPAVLITANVHISLDAVSRFGFRVCSCCIALIPNGVAALPIPSKLALRFIKMAFMAG